MASLTALVCSSKYVLRNILGSKNHLKMKHCMIEIKEKNYYCQKLCRKCGQEPSPRPFQIFIKFYIKSKQTEFGCDLWGILIVCHRRLLTFIKQLYSIIKKKRYSSLSPTHNFSLILQKKIVTSRATI